MTHCASDGLLIEGSLKLRSRSQRTGKQSNGVMAAFAVARGLNPLRAIQHFNIAQIKRFAEGVCVCGLTPLPMYVLVTTPTVAGRQKCGCRNEATAFGDRLTWREWAAAERQMVRRLGRAMP